MAYENMTYESILQRMITRVSVEYPDIDTREGSILFNALAPAALELSIAYTALHNVLCESFVTTASREYLLRACSQMGMDITNFNATYSVHKGEFNVEVPVGSRWNHDLYNYTVTEYIGKNESENHEYKLTCDTLGVEPNVVKGELMPITSVPNDLTLANLTECLIEGEDEASDDTIRQAYSDFVNSTVVDGNVKQYKKWCEEYDGIGNAKVIPCWNGVNTVKVSILSASNGVATDELIADFQEYLDPNSEGMGNGVAPIGSKVTVTTATEKTISVSATVKMADGYTDTKPIEDLIKTYLLAVAYNTNTVGYMMLGAVILATEGVESLNDLKLNGGTSDITLGDEEIPVLGEVNWVVK